MTWTSHVGMGFFFIFSSFLDFFPPFCLNLNLSFARDLLTGRNEILNFFSFRLGPAMAAPTLGFSPNVGGSSDIFFFLRAPISEFLQNN